MTGERTMRDYESILPVEEMVAYNDICLMRVIKFVSEQDLDGILTRMCTTPAWGS